MKRIITIMAVGLCCMIAVGPVRAQDVDSVREYRLYLRLGQDALLREDYDLARDYFSQAQILQPGEQAPTAYLNYLKRQKEHSVWGNKNRGGFQSEPQGVVADQVYSQATSSIEVRAPELRQSVIQESLDEYLKEKFQLDSDVESVVSRSEQSGQAVQAVDKSQSSSALPGRTRPEIDLDDALWAAQPRGLIQILLGQSIILDGNNIDRYLDILPGFLEVTRVNRNRIRIVGVNRGTTIFHVWDDRGRWTFNIEVLLPFELESQKVIRRTREEYAKPFRFIYSADWSAYNMGRSLSDTKRQSLNFLQTLKVEGETPYGKSDGWMVYTKYPDSTELTGYGVGLTDGRIGWFDQFTIRGFDLSKTFSELSMPGQYVRGVLFEKRAFDDNVDFSYIRGKDRATYGFLAPNLLDERDSYVEGARVTLFGNQENNYSLNVARGWGSARPLGLKDQVYSVQVNRRVGKVYIKSELANDGDTFAGLLSAEFDKINEYDLSFHLRNIGADFATIVNQPSNRGEVGGVMNLGWDWGQARWTQNVDLYKDRLLYNPEDPDAWNVDASSYVDYQISDTQRITGSAFYVNTPGEVSPRNNLRLFTNYVKWLDWWENHPLTITAGAGYQRSRYDFSSVSDFDRKMLSVGMQLPLYQRLHYFMNYEYSWVDDNSEKDYTPRVLNTGLNYSHTFADNLSGNASLSYRDEQNTDGLNSFLSGQDSLTFQMGLNYRPFLDTEIYADGRVRNVWREGADSAAYHEIDMRWGVRSGWDLPLRWNPSGMVAGTVYKDFNGNGKRDADEPGIPEVTVMVGDTTVTTDANGHYAVAVKAKSVLVQLGIESLPRGFVASTVSDQTVQIVPHQWQGMDFGVSTKAGIFGIVYYDVNGNGQPDTGDVFIQRTVLRLDNKEATQTGFDGTYFFRDVQPGTYTLTIDVNTLPMDYIPLVKLRNQVTVEEGMSYVFHVPVRKK